MLRHNMPYMPISPVPSTIEIDVSRIRELSKDGRHAEALAAAESLAENAPQNRDAIYLIAANQRCLHRIGEALRTLQLLEEHHPNYSLLYQERGHCYLTLRDAPRAIDAFLRAIQLNPALPASWVSLERLYRMTGNSESAAKAAEQVAILQRMPREVLRAAGLFADGDLFAAETILRAYLQNGGDHVEGLRILARIRHQRGFLSEAERLLDSVAKRTPELWAGRLDLVRVLIDAQKYSKALETINSLLQLEPGNREYLSMYAASRAGLGHHENAILLYRRMLVLWPGSWDLHMALGHSLKTVGQQKEAIESYLSAAAARPGFGDAYWSLANLKTYRFSEDEIAYMRAREAAPGTQPVDRYHLCFALGKACEDRSEYEKSWEFYQRGNALKRTENHYAPEMIDANAREQMNMYTTQFFQAHAGVGAQDSDPIFIVGLPRSGSTLIEQILASHSQVEGTQELADIPQLAGELDGDPSDPSYRGYPHVLRDLAPEAFRELGKRYMTDTRAYRGDKPFFIDKMPNNFRHIGLIHLILPNARIIDVRREPMACCFSNLKQLFAKGQEFSYSIEDIARYYRTYLELMRHWDEVLPGRVLRVSYEDVVDDLDGNVRRILKYCGLEFEPACIEFYRTQRTVRTVSSEQVRQPIYRQGLLQWLSYESWLDPLKDALGDALTRYRD